MSKISYEDIKANEAINTYITKGNHLLGVLGFTEHSHAHCVKVGTTAADILNKLGVSEREQELALIAGYMHDIGNSINRYDHPITGAVMSYKILTDMGMPTEEIADVIAAIGNHDEGSGQAVNNIAAAIIIADKTDVRRSRVRNKDMATFDIHDRVNYASEQSELLIDSENRSITLRLEIDTKICSMMDYFEIFLTRMLMCKRSAEFLNATFGLVVNETKLA